MYKRLLIVARDYNQAQHWAKDQRMSPGQYVYVSSFHNILGNAGCEYVLLDGWKQRPDSFELSKYLETHCTERSPTKED